MSLMSFDDFLDSIRQGIIKILDYSENGLIFKKIL
jgi:hypothetical protein